MNSTGTHPDPAGDPRLALVPASPRAQAWLFGLVVCLPLALVGATELAGRGDNANGIAWHALGGVAAFCLALWAALAVLLRRHRLRLGADGLEVTTTFYRRHFPLAGLDLEAARVANLDERPEFRAMLRTNGVSLPGFRSGWFRLRSGSRSLVATAGGRRLLWIPTAAGHDLLLQPGDPRALLDALRALARQAGQRH